MIYSAVPLVSASLRLAHGLRPIFSQKHNFVSKLPNCVLRENARLIANVNIIPQLEHFSNKNTLYSMQIAIF